MATLTTQGLCIGYGDGLASHLIFNAAVDIRPQLVTFGGTFVTASGRIIGTSEPGAVHTYDVRIGQMVRADREALAALAKAMISLRTGRGECLFGTFWALSYPYRAGLDRADVSFVFNELTYSYAV
jgi:hypothetical protein